MVGLHKGLFTMDDNTIIPEKRRKLKVSHILIVLLLIAIGGFVLYKWQLRSKLQARIDAIRAAGYPVTCAELDEWYSIPQDAENAAYTIIDAFSYYRGANEAEQELLPIVGRAELPAGAEPLPAEMMKVIGQYLADNEQALELLHKAAAIEHSRYPVDLSAGMDALMPYLRDIRNMARLLGLEAITHAGNDKAGQAVDSVVSVFGVARSLEKEPLLISQLVRFACQSVGLSSIERVVNKSEVSDEQLAELSGALAAVENHSGLLRAVAGERCALLEVFRQPDSVDPQLFARHRSMGVLFRAYRAVGLSDKGAMIYLDLVDEFLEALRLPEHERVKAAKAAEAKLSEVPRIHVMVHVLMPAHSRIVELSLRNTAHLRVARVGLAIERYRLAAGKLPEKIADLVPAYLDNVPKDPFDGEDLRYKPLGPLAGKLERGFVVYSIGEDGSDDGGKERPPRSKRKGDPNWDITFTVER